MIKGVIFDFNGTLYFDNDINYRAWEKIYYDLVGESTHFPMEYKKYQSLGNDAFIKHIFEFNNLKYTNEDIRNISIKKEEYYQKISIEENRTILAPGAIDLLNYLKIKNIKINIATRSIEENVKFYFKYFGLDKWFSINKIIYGSNYTNKGEMFALAANSIDLSLNECLIIEDSKLAIDEALELGANSAIYLNVDGEKYNCEGVVNNIKDFRDLSNYF